MKSVTGSFGLWSDSTVPLEWLTTGGCFDDVRVCTEAQKMIDMADVLDHDGKLSFDEFYRMMSLRREAPAAEDAAGGD